MGGSFLHAVWSPALVLACGLLAFLGFAGLGNAVARVARLQMPEPWRFVCALMLGIQCIALGVELAAMAGLASPVFLRGLAWLLLAIGGLAAVLCGPRLRASMHAGWSGATALFLLLAALALASGLLTAMAPSTKIDELHYHMLAPARIAAEGRLIFYREPWEAAIWPHMAFQVALTPLHALGIPDAGNVVGWALGATLAWFAWAIVAESSGPGPWPAAWAAALSAGVYAAVWHVTAGSHAMGDLALAACVVGFMQRERLAERLGFPRQVALMSLLALGAGSSKLSLLPIAFLLLAMTFAFALRASGARWDGRLALSATAPWVLFLGPVVAWTAWASGSPFGPVLGDVLSGSVYDAATLGDIATGTREANAASPARVLFDALAGYSPMVWLGVGGAMLFRSQPVRERRIAAGLLAVQMALILGLLYPGVRFLGGLHYGLAISFAAGCAAPVLAGLARIRRLPRVALALAMILPWLGSQLYYAAGFVPVALGAESREAFSRRHVALYEDFKALDRILPADAVFLCTGFRAPSVYAPRPVFYDSADLPAGRPVFELMDPAERPAEGSPALGGRMRGEVVYRNAQAVVEAYRTPGRVALTGTVEVVRLGAAPVPPLILPRPLHGAHSP